MLSPFLIIGFAFSLLITTSAVPTIRTLGLLTPSDVSPPILSNSSSPALLLAENLVIRRRPGCWPETPPITNPADCVQAKFHMLLEGPNPDEPLVWDRDRGWIYKSCVLYLTTSSAARHLPIYRGTFSRNDIGACAERIQTECVTAEHGYRGGKIAIDTGLFEVSLAPVPPSLQGLEKGTTLNTTAFD